MGKEEGLGKNQQAPVLCQAGCTLVNKQTWSSPSWIPAPRVGDMPLKQGNKHMTATCESRSDLREKKRGGLC